MTRAERSAAFRVACPKCAAPAREPCRRVGIAPRIITISAPHPERLAGVYALARGQ